MTELRALLLTDVVDSTQLSQAIGDEAMAEVWAAHDRAARDLLPAWRGREIDKTDGMLLMFDHASDAVQYALAYHRALAAMPRPLKARAGLHVGPVLLRENTPEDVARGAKPLEVDGLAKPTAARVMAIARGGQTLITPEARDELGRTPLKLQSHGHWMVKGVSDPIELFEVGEEGQRMIAPPDGDKAWRVVRHGDWWMPVTEIPNNLPQQATSFIGRERELADLVALLPSARMLTLVGMGGLGKTRLSLQVAAETLHRYPDGVWFLDLAPIRDPALVLAETARVLGLTEEPDRPLLQTVCTHLRTKRVLFIMDNCEHLIESSAGLAFAIIQAAPHVHLIASSREGLHIPAERTYPILPLALPAPGARLEDLARSPAVQLFVDRARQHKPGYTLDARDAPAVVELVARLEGIPLALELAAARVRSLTVADINARLKDRYKLLTGGARGLQARQQTLRALVDWSYELLGPSEQTLLNRLGIFVGGFDLAAAEAVCSLDPLDEFEVMDLLASLVEKSLVMLDEQDGSSRYRMLETLREYARDKLGDAGEVPAIGARHGAHYLALAKEANLGLKGPQHAEWIRRIELEMDNLRSAMTLSLGGAVDPFIVVRIAAALLSFWMLRGHATEGRGIVRAALALPAIQQADVAQAWALYVGAALAGSQSEHAQARAMLESCLDLRRRLGNPVDIAATLSTLALTRLQAGDAVGAADSEQEALGLFRTLGNRLGEAIGLLHLGQIALAQAEDDAARDHLRESLAIAREMGNPELEAECELTLGACAFERGERPAARQHLDRAWTVAQTAGDMRGEATAQWWRGRVDLAEGQADSARQRLQEALAAFHRFEMWDELLGCLEDHARLARASAQPDLAVRLASSVTRARERLGLQRHPRREARWQDFIRELHAQWSADDYDADWTLGQGWDIDDAIRHAA